MKELISNLLKAKIPLKKEKIETLIEIPPDKNLGDYAFPCFSLAKEFKKNPAEISKDIAQQLNPTKEIEKIAPVGAYINFFINSRYLVENTIKKILKEREKYGSQKIKEKVMVEFSQANTHKAFHIGHVRGTSLGESISRILEFAGNKVIRANYQGDTGMHVAKWLWCYIKYHSKEKLKKEESWIAHIYVEAVKKLSENPDLQNEVDAINKKLDSGEDKKLNALWKKTRELSLNSLEPIYKELDTRFSQYFFESQMEKRGKEISKQLAKKSIAKISDGAAIVDLEKYKLGVWILLRSDGTVLYSAKDLVLAEEKFKKFKLDKSIYVVGSAQRLHFNQLFKTLELMGFEQAQKCIYIPVTEVRLPTGKMSSRTGENILYSEFKKELISYAKEEIQKRIKLSEKELNARSLAITIASLKYSMLKQDTNKTITFNKEEALQFEGNTGPYLLYTYARARSILRKVGYSPKKKYNVKEISDQEKNLIFQLANFPQITLNACQNLAPNVIANYAYELSQTFNEFYHTEKVIGSEKESFRLVLVDAISQILKNSLYLLGIKTLEKM